MDDFYALGERALAWAQEHYPDASANHQAAFANSVVYARLRLSSPYGGPSVREHVANRLLNDSLVDWSKTPLEEIYLFLVSPIFGALTEDHLRFWLRFPDLCHEDDPDDLRVLAEHAEKYKFETLRLWAATVDNIRQIAALRNESIVAACDRLAKEEMARLRRDK